MCFDTGAELTLYYGSVIAKCAVFFNTWPQHALQLLRSNLLCC